MSSDDFDGWYDDELSDEEGPEATREELASEVADLRGQVASLQRQLAERVVRIGLLMPGHEHTTMAQHQLVLTPGVIHTITVAGICTEIQRVECGTDKVSSLVQVDLGVTLQ